MFCHKCDATTITRPCRSRPCEMSINSCFIWTADEAYFTTALTPLGLDVLYVAFRLYCYTAR